MSFTYLENRAIVIYHTGLIIRWITEQITVTSCKGMVRVDNNDHVYQHLHNLVSSTATQCLSSMVDSELTRTLFAASPNCSSVCDVTAWVSIHVPKKHLWLDCKLLVFLAMPAVLVFSQYALDVISSLSPKVLGLLVMWLPEIILDDSFFPL